MQIGYVFFASFLKTHTCRGTLQRKQEPATSKEQSWDDLTVCEKRLMKTRNTPAIFELNFSAFLVGNLSLGKSRCF